MSIRSIALGLAVATVGTLSLAGLTATSSEAHHRHHHRHHLYSFGAFYGPSFYAYNYAPCGWIYTRRGKFWSCY